MLNGLIFMHKSMVKLNEENKALRKINDDLKLLYEAEGLLPLALHIEVLTFTASRLEKEKAELVELLEKSHAECNDLSNEKLEILDRLVRLESENATLKAKAEKEYRGYKFKSTI